MRTFAVESLPLLVEELRAAAEEGPIRLTLGGKIVGVFLTPDEFEEHEKALDHVLGTYAMHVSENGDFLSPEESVSRLNQLIDAARPLAS